MVGLQIPSDAQVIFVVDDRRGLADWLVGLDGPCYVGVASTDRMAAYVHATGLRVFSARSPLDYAAAVMSDLVVEGVYDEVEANGCGRSRPRSPMGPRRSPRAGPEGSEGDERAGTGSI